MLMFDAVLRVTVYLVQQPIHEGIYVSTTPIRRLFLMMVCMILTMTYIPIPKAYAATVVAEPAPTSYWLDSSALEISAYQWDEAGRDIQLVELYNTSDLPISLDDWTIQGTFGTVGADKKLATSGIVAMAIMRRGGGAPGYIAPGAHVVVDAGRGVSNASFEMTTWSGMKPNDKLYSLTTIPKFRTMMTNEYVLKSPTGMYDELMRRVPSTDGYTSTLTNFTSAPVTQLYDRGLYAVPEAPGFEVVEIYPYAKNCDPFDADPYCHDYIKLYNGTNEPIDLAAYALRTDSSSTNRTTSNTIQLDVYGSLAPQSYLAVHLTDDGAGLNLTNSGGYVWLEDAWGMKVFENTMRPYESAGTTKQQFGYALNAAGGWEWTSLPNPVGANEFPIIVSLPTDSPGLVECPSGKYRSPETNRCRAIEEAVNELASCPEGQSRNPATNRCRSVAAPSSVSASLVPCGEGQERNPLTNRCRSIASAVAELLPCDEGYERNPSTNRCRKIPLSDVPLAAYPVEPMKQTAQSAGMWWAVAGILVAASAYAVWEWRREITQLVTRVVRRKV